MRELNRFVIAALTVVLIPLGAWAQTPGTVVTIAGGGTQEGENIRATDVALNLPLSLSLDAQGNIYIADTENHRIRRVDITTGTVSTVVGNGEPGFSGDGGPAINAQLNRPNAVAVDNDGTVYIGDTNNRRIRRVDPAGIITTIAGTGVRGFSGDNGPALEATFWEIKALLVGGGLLYVSDGLDANNQGTNRVRQMILSTGIIATVAGNGSATASGVQDGGSPILAGLTPEQLAFGPAPDFKIHIADFNNGRIRSLHRTTDTTSAITTVAGRSATFAEQISNDLFKGDGGPANQALFFGPTGVVLDVDGNIYIADSNNQRIRVVEAATGNVLTLAGTGVAGIGEENALGLGSDLNFPLRLLVDARGDLIFIDAGTNRIRKLFGSRYRTPLFSAITSGIDFDKVSLGDPVTRTLDVQNLGNLPVTILSGVSDNPAFRVILPELFQVGVSQAAQIEVVFDPIGEGVVTGLITLTTDDPRTPSATFEVTGVGEAPQISLFPKDLLLFDRTFIGQSTTATIRIANIGAGILVVRQAAASDTQFVAQLTDPIRIASGQSQNLNISFRPVKEDTQRAVLKLLTNAPNDSVVSINLQGIGQLAKPGGFADVSPSLGLGDVGAGFGASWADLDNDGDPDLYLVRSLEANRFYRNDGVTFTERASALGLADTGDGSSAIFGDADRDGDLDVYLTNFGQPNRFYRNDGGAFLEMAAALGIDDAGDGNGAAWADADKDGDLDLYVANFGANRYFQNDGPAFTDRTDSVGLSDVGSSVQPAWADYDNDGDLDLFVANSGPNRLYRNDGGLFQSVESLFSPADSGPSFGAAWADYDNDGDLDLFVSYFNEVNRFYINDNNRFQLAIPFLGLSAPGRARAAVWGDFDNDGFLDLYVTNSGQPNQFYRNSIESGARIFTEQSAALGLDRTADSRGAAAADYDGDGGLDMYVAVQKGPDALFRNQESNGNWIAIWPISTESGVDAIGLRVELSYGNGRQAIREISGGSSYLSQNDRNLLVGLADAQQLDVLTLRWPSGIVQQFVGGVDNLRVNQTLSITETPPLPPSKIRLESNAGSLLANGVSEAILTATILNDDDKRVLISDRAVRFRIETGDGIFVGSDSVAVKDGFATARYRASQTPGPVRLVAESAGLTAGRVAIDLIKPFGDQALTVRTVAGSGAPGFDGDGGPATESSLQLPRDVLTDANGNIYIADTANNRIRFISVATGFIETRVGTGLSTSSGDGGPAVGAAIADPQGLTLFNGRLYIGEAGGQVIRRVLNDTIATAAGTGVAQFGGDGGPATRANLNRPLGIATDLNGNLYVADSFSRRVRKIDPSGIISTLAGSGSPDVDGFSGDGGPANLARLSRVSAVVVDSLGRVFIADTQNHRIRMVDTNGIITTVAGSGIQGFAGDGGPAALADLSSPQGLTLDRQDNLYIADTGNHRVRLVNLSTRLIQTVAGTGNARFDLEEGGARAVSLNNPTGLAVGPTGTVFIADRSNHRIRELSIQFDLPSLFAPTEKSADFNGDGQVSFSDFLLFVGGFQSQDARYDLNGDGFVNLADFILFASALASHQTLVRP
ncbi:MAG: FG-GAP-like repeat-containing protein [bacterium]|nr:FG-GAP-like repeat-containing protein [bacterium]